MLLNKINKPKDLKKLTLKEKEELANEIRTYLLEVVSTNGGHLASNLGVVELTIALHSVFNTPTDKIIWDVGHQSYVHKILTGRREEFKSLRQKDGISGFPKSNESIYDVFDTGHSSTSISAALGLAKGRDILHESYRVVAVIGDGALTGGMALEGLNDCGYSKTDITIVLNDNEMSISKNVGGISLCLSRIRSSKFHNTTNNSVKKVLESIPVVGYGTVNLFRRLKRGLKQLLLPNMFFEDLGFTYLGPVDGHNILELETILKRSKNIKGPKLIHVVTKKGKGYKIAEENPDKFHGVSAFNIETGLPLKESKDDYSKIFGNKLVELAKDDKKIVAVCAAMKTGTGLSLFAEKYPNRFFDVGIAEQHALTFAAGLAKSGLKPVISLYSSFYQRGYDQVIHDIAIQNLPVVMCVDRAGLVGNDGETHQGLFDLSMFSIIPNLTIMAPKGFKELELMLSFAFELNRPVMIRYPRGGEDILFTKNQKIELGKSEILATGDNVSIITIGKMTSLGQRVHDELLKNNIKSDLINTRFLKPIDKNTIVKSIKKTHNIIVIEDNIIEGGLTTKIKELIVDEKLDASILSFAYPDSFIKQGSVSEMEEEYGFTVDNIVRTFMKNWELK